MDEASRSDLMERARDACGGVAFYFASWSGETPLAFWPQEVNSPWRRIPYGRVLVIGGGIQTVYLAMRSRRHSKISSPTSRII